MLYLTLDEIKKHLNIDSDFTDDDSYLESLETVAVELIQKHIDHALNLLEVDGQLPLSLKQGILLCVGNFYNNRESIAYTSSHEIPSNLQWILDLYQYYDSTSESGGDSDIDKKITELEKKITELVTAIESKADQSVIDTLTSDINTLTTTVSSLSTTISTKLDIDTFTTYQSTVDTKFDNIEKEIVTSGKVQDVQVNGTSVLDNRIAKIDLTGYAASSDLEPIQTQVATNQKNIKTNADNIISVKEDISQVEDDILTLEGKIPTKTSQLENDSNYYKPGDALIIQDNEVVMKNSSGISVMVAEFSNNNIDLFEGTFTYRESGPFIVSSDIEVTDGTIMAFKDNSTISLMSDDQTLNIQCTGISLGDGTAKQLYSTDGNTYDISSLESSVSTNTSNISSIQTTIGNIDTLLTTILNG